MVSINYAFREICCKIVYYGPGLSGKTTNLIYIHKKAPPQTKGELISLATDADRTLYFDFLPLDIGPVQGFSTKFQLYTVPGQVYYNATRKLVLRGVDGLVFVADSQAAKLEENIESMNNLVENLEEYGYILEELPMVMQYNKRDLEEVSSIEELESVLNPRGLAYFEAVAVKGEGVFDTLKGISKLVLEKARGKSEPVKKEELVEVTAPAKVYASPSVRKEEGGSKPIPETISRREFYEEGVKAEKEVKPLELEKEIELTEVSGLEKEKRAEEKKVVEGVEMVGEKEVEEEAGKVKSIEKLEWAAEKEKKVKGLEEERKLEEVVELKEESLIQSQSEIQKETFQAKKALEEEALKKAAEAALAQKTKPPLEEKVIISPMLRQKRIKSAPFKRNRFLDWSGYLWNWIRKIAGRR